MTQARILVEGIQFGEGPRCGPDGRLYLSDFYGHEVLVIDLETGGRQRVCEVPGQPSGLGWLPDGRLLVVSMLDRAVWRLEPDGQLVKHADLSDIATFHTNDMLVDRHGRAYVGNFGFDLHRALAEGAKTTLLDPNSDPPGAALALVEQDGSVRVVAEDLKFPNGTVLLADGRLVIAETIALRLTVFDVAEDGSLSNKRVWADLRQHGIAPDGICVDSEGGIWVAPAIQPMAVRVVEGGEITDRVEASQLVFAVALAGPQRRTLVCCTAPSSMPGEVHGTGLGKLEVAEVAIPGHLQ